MASNGAYYPGGNPYSQGYVDPRAQQPGSQFAAPMAPGQLGQSQPSSQYYQDGQSGGYMDQSQTHMQTQDGVNGISAQMGGLAMADGAPARTQRRKQRHAYHDISQASPAAQSPSQPQAGPGSGGQFFNGGQMSTPAVGSPQLGGVQNNNMVNPADRLRMGEESVATQGRVDPEQLPSVARSRDAATHFYQQQVYSTMERHVPPAAAVPYVAHDQGNSSPKYARLTVNNIPSTQESLNSTGLPLGLVLQPFAPVQEGEQPIPVLDFGEAGPPRCRRCRTYVNPFMTFRSGGNKMVCNMCNFPNEVNPEYFAPTDASGARVDRLQRPELLLGTVEYVVPKEYYTKEPVSLRWLIMIDVSAESVNRGFVHSVCEGVLSALYGHDREGEHDDTQEPPETKLLPGTRVGIVTYDKEVHFYNLGSGLTTAQMLVMSDLEDPFVPLSEGLFVDSMESKEVITALLTSIPEMFNIVKNPEPALLSTLNAALAALSATGGKVICALSTLPTFGPGRLHQRDDGKGRDTEHERKLFTTEHPGYKKTAGAMVTAGIGVDFFLGAPGGAYLDVATIGHLSRTTGGEVYLYPNFIAPRDSLKLAEEMKHSLHRETGYQGLMKVRCSTGLQVSAYHGSFLQHTFGADLEMGTIDADKAIGIMFSYDGKLDVKLDAHFQAALLYTTASGQRRVRCVNIVAGVSEGATETMRTVDQDAVVNIIAKEAAAKLTEKSLKDIRASITEKTVDILAGYRKNFSGSHPPGQLVLPENLKEFSMYMLGLIKSRAFKGGIEPVDRRVHAARFLQSAGTTESSLYIYPRIYPIHNLGPEDCFSHVETMQLIIPPTLRASFARVEEGGVYLVDDGQVTLIWLHAQVSPNLLEDLFGEDKKSLHDLDPQLNALPILQTHLNAQVRNLIQYISTIRGSKAATIQLARQGLDGSEYEFARMLVEDRNNEAQSYVDWLVHIHRAIQMELSGQRKKEVAAAEGEGIIKNLTGMNAPYWT